MALKKKLEKEYQEANERLNERSSYVKKYHPMKFDNDSRQKYSPVAIRRKHVQHQDDDDEEDLKAVEEERLKKLKEEEERMRMIREEEERKRKELELRLKEAEEENERQLEEKRKLEEENRRKFEEKERKRLEEKERKRKMKEKLKQAQKRRDEKKAKEEKEMEDIRAFVLQTTDQDLELFRQEEDRKYEEMRQTEEKIRQLEMSIATLDGELERYDLENMKAKTRKVVKRMSLVIKDTEDEEIDMILKATTVTSFMENEDLWGKYLQKGSVA